MQGKISKGHDGKIHIPGKGIVLWKSLAKLLKVLNPSLKLSVDGAESISETHDGLHIKIGAGGGLAERTLVVNHNGAVGYRDFQASEARDYV